MVDKITFMETLRSVAEVTKTSNAPLSREEIKSYFDNMELSKEQQEMVYQYFANREFEEEIPNHEPDEESRNTEENTEEELTTESLSDSSFFQMYLEDINVLPDASDTEREELYHALLCGDETVVQRISDIWLKQVIEIAKEYASREVNIEDIIQEGNIGLLLGLNSLLGSKDSVDINGYLTHSIKESMEQFIDQITAEDDWEHTMVAKASLVHEAITALTNELGHIPSRSELSNYTKLTLDEIDDILNLSKDSGDNEESANSESITPTWDDMEYK